MSKKSDDSIERFFKKAVAQQDLSHLDSDWKNMEKMLDEHALAPSAANVGIRKKVVTYSIVGAVFFFGMYLAVTRPWESASANQLATKTTQTTKPSQAAAGMLGPLSGTKENPSADLLSSDQKTKVPASDAISVIAQPKIGNEVRPDDVSHAEQGSANENATTKILVQENEDQSNLLPPVENAASTTDRTTTPEVLPTEYVGVQSVNAKSIETEITDDATADSVVQKEEIETKDISESKEEDKPPITKVLSRWSAALTVAPDFSSTSVGRYSAPGTAYGFFVSYRPLPRWQVSTGLIKTAKQYEGYGDEYQPPPGYWENRTNGIVPDGVEGNCGIIEWPLILRFDFIAKANSRFYVASGVSSYLMRHESYQYNFAHENPGAASGWKSSGPTSYSFSIGHLSAGYERSFSNRIAVAIEPYFKIPFKAIGWSNIDLHTTGAYVTVRYTFQKQSIVTTTQK